MNELTLELRDVNESRREIVGCSAPYGETSYLTGSAGGERLMRGCFAQSIRHRGDRIPLVIGHNHRTAAIGLSTGWDDTDAGLIGTFQVRSGDDADQALSHAAGGYLSKMSVGFEPLPARTRRAKDGAVEILEGRLHEVSLVAVGAYGSAQVLAVRSAEQIAADLAAMVAPFRVPMPEIDMSPLPPIWSYDAR
jgi:uncharacterized protein